MRICLLAWGSLVWDKRDLPKIRMDWARGGPALPIEFSRISESRDDILTLVIDPKNGVRIPTRFSDSSRSYLEDAICDLRSREGTIYSRIGFVDLVNGTSRCNAYPEAEIELRKWASDNKYDAVVWTDLSSNFYEYKEKKISFSVENAIEHIKSLKRNATKSAFKYIHRAPEEADTPFRNVIQKDDWYKRMIEEYQDPGVAG